MISKSERAVEGGSGEKPEMGARTGLVDSGAGHREQTHGRDDGMYLPALNPKEVFPALTEIGM